VIAQEVFQEVPEQPGQDYEAWLGDAHAVASFLIVNLEDAAEYCPEAPPEAVVGAAAVLADRLPVAI
jgi:hypothetical protein